MDRNLVVLDTETTWSDKVRKGAGEKVTPDSPEDAVAYIVGKLTDKHVI